MLTYVTADKYQKRKKNVFFLTKFSKKDKIIYYSFLMLEKKTWKWKINYHKGKIKHGYKVTFSFKIISSIEPR